MPSSHPSPCFVMEKEKLDVNLAIFSKLQKQTNITWLYTLKCFHEKEGLTHIAQALSGFSIGNLNELSKTKEVPYKHIHSYAPAFYEKEVLPLAKASHTMSFNSLSQWKRYSHTSDINTSLGLRINPKLSLKQPAHCDASSENSRFGVDYQKFIDEYREDTNHFESPSGIIPRPLGRNHVI